MKYEISRLTSIFLRVVISWSSALVLLYTFFYFWYEDIFRNEKSYYQFRQYYKMLKWNDIEIKTSRNQTVEEFYLRWNTSIGFDPNQRYQVWRYLTYSLVTGGNYNLYIKVRMMT